MMIQRKKKSLFTPEIIIISLLSLFYVGGLLNYYFNYNFRPIFISTIPYNILFCVALVWGFQQNKNFRFLIITLAVFAFGYLVELLGVSTGWAFGNYTYGTLLGLKLWDVPLMIGLNWILIGLLGWSIAARFNIHFFFRLILSALLMVGYDFVLEPVAMSLGMWTWENNIIPFRNYTDWFIVSFIISYIISKWDRKPRNKIALPIYIIHILFFIVLKFMIS